MIYFSLLSKIDYKIKNKAILFLMELGITAGPF